MAKEGTPHFEIPADMRKKASNRPSRLLIFSFQRRNTRSVRRRTRRPACKLAPRKLANLRWGSRSETSRPRSNLRNAFYRPKNPKDVMALHAEYRNSQIAALTDRARNLANEWPR